MRIGIALGGGGAKGLAHIGVLQTLSEAGIDCDVVSGTSAGALVGAFYAANALDKLVEEVNKVRLTDIPLLLSPTLTVSGLFSGRNVIERITELVGVSLIEELPKRFAAVTVDLNASEIVTISQGSISHAIRASISIPVVFTPIVDGQRLLVDGATMEPVPVQTARTLGADFVIAVDLFGDNQICEEASSAQSYGQWPTSLISAASYLRSLASSIRQTEVLPSSTLRERHAASNIVDIISRTLALTQRALTAARLKQHPPDLVIMPPVAHVGMLDFHHAAPIIELGRQAAVQALPRLRHKLNRCEQHIAIV